MPDTDNLDSRIAYAHRMIQRCIEADPNTTPLGIQIFLFLFLQRHRAEPVPLAELKSHFQISSMKLTRAYSQWIPFIEISTDENDRRIRVLRITQEGIDLLTDPESSS